MKTRRKTPTDIAHRHATVKVDISKAHDNIWLVTPHLTVFPSKVVVSPKNIIFLLDISGSMSGRPLGLVKSSMYGLLDQLVEKDTFSIVEFESSAKCLVAKQTGNQENIAAAKAQVKGMTDRGGTSFHSAFSMVASQKLIGSVADATIIFLTDGGDSGCTPSQLIDLVRVKGHAPRIVPIGIGLEKGDNHHKYLCDLAREANNGKIEPIFINDATDEAYKNAFQRAFNLASEQSTTPAILEAVIEARDVNNTTRSKFKRQLGAVVYDGKQAGTYTFYVDSCTPPSVCDIRYVCDKVSLQGKVRLSKEDIQKVANHEPVSVSIDRLKWKDNRVLSWLACLSEIGLGFVMLAGAVAFALLSPFSFMLTSGASAACGALGVALVLHGLIAVARKTLFLPTVPAELSVAPTEDMLVEIKPTPKPKAKLAPAQVKQSVPASAKSKPLDTGTPSNSGIFSCLKFKWPVSAVNNKKKASAGYGKR